MPLQDRYTWIEEQSAKTKETIFNDMLGAYSRGRSDCLAEIAELKKPLLPHELKLIAQLLDMASDSFGNHICNDFDLPDTQRSRDMLVAMHKWNDKSLTDDSEEIIEVRARKKPYTMDWFLMDYLAHRVREMLAEEES